mgnify:CR=1 FL=1
MDMNNLTEPERIVLNTLIIGGIAFFSSLTITGFPTIENVWAAFVGASLAGLTQLLALTRQDSQSNIPKDYRRKPPRLGMLI